MKQASRSNAEDNVAVVAQDTLRGEALRVGEDPVIAIQDIPQGHKVAVSDIPAGEFVMKYGVPIGRARTHIAAGEHVHVHNVEDVTEELCLAYRKKLEGKGGRV
jgi:altronate hydrolase